MSWGMEPKNELGDGTEKLNPRIKNNIESKEWMSWGMEPKNGTKKWQSVPEPPTLLLLINKDKSCFSVILIIQLLRHFCSILYEKQDRKFLKVHWSDFHLSSLNRVVPPFPVIPVDSILWRRVIQTVQVGVRTVCVPPGSISKYSTLSARPAVVILIFGCKVTSTNIRKGITSSS